MFLTAYRRALGVIVKKPLMLWGLALLGSLLTIVGSVVTMPVIALSAAVGYLFTCGLAKVYLDGLEEKEVNSKQLFAGFSKNALRIAGAMAWRDLWILIWALIPIAGPVLAIIKSYSYRFVPYIVMTQPEVSAFDALKLSMKMTEGKKLQMFLADLCFGGGLVVAFWILGLFSSIPYIGILFGLVTFVAAIAAGLFGTIFVGLYQAAFYNAPAAAEPAPAVEVPVEEAPVEEGNDLN